MFKSHVLIALGLLSLLMAACTGAEKPSKPAQCVPQCGVRCEGDDGCGGECDCTPVDECGDRCAPHERCVGAQCVCQPSCGKGNQCGPDGCGGMCPCSDDLVQNALGDWVPRDECDDTCSAAGWTCGVLCGEPCGGCQDGAACSLGQCGCVPHCDGTSCNDGCGGTCDCAPGLVCNPSDACVKPEDCDATCGSEQAGCGTVCGQECGFCGGTMSCQEGKCVEGVSCATCSLQLKVLSKRSLAGRLLEVTVALDYAPGEQEPKPRLADFRIAANRDVQLMTVETGEALTEASKELYRDPATGARFRRHGDGSYQLMAFGLGNVEEIGAGRLATLTFAVGSTQALELRIVRRHQTFAPPLSDTALQASTYDRGLVVTP
jgi:hypothetical protein